MKVLKLVYMAHGFNLAITDDPLINDRVEAWKFGPVIRPLYGKLKQFGSGAIPSVSDTSLRKDYLIPIDQSHVIDPEPEFRKESY